jgi:ATP-dependent RNA helicase DeaD
LQPDLTDIPAAPPAREYGEKPQREKRTAKADFAAKPTLADGELRRYRIEVGRNLGATPKEIVGAIANEGGIAGKYIGQIHLFAEFATVELPADLPQDVLATLKKTRVKQTPLNLRPFDGEAPEPHKAPRKAPSRAPSKTRFDKPKSAAAPRKRKP